MPNEERHASGRARSSHFGDANCREHRDAEVMLRVGLPLPGVPAYPHRCDSGIRVAHRGNRAKGGVDMSANRENWRSQGVCRSYDPDLFFPVSSSGLFLEQVADAKAICMKCPYGLSAWSSRCGHVRRTACGAARASRNGACSGDVTNGELIQTQAKAARIVCTRMTAVHRKAQQ